MSETDTEADESNGGNGGSKRTTHRVGDTVTVKAGAEVTRPDGSRHTMGGTTYVLDVPGTHEVGGTEYKVKR